MTHVVGREVEIAMLGSFLAGDAAGPNVLAILGEAGIGKTTVWREAVERVRAGGATVLAARPAEAEARLTFAGLTDLLGHVPGEALEALPAPQRDALDVALLRVAAERPADPRLVGTAFLSLLRALASTAEVAVAVDDLQWLDPPSAAAVEFAFRRLEDEPVRAIVSVRTGEDGGSPLARIAREQRLRRLELGPLSVASLHRIVAATLGRTFPRPTLVRIARASGGNPLYALEIAQQLAAAGHAAALPVPEGLHELVTARVRALPAATRAALLRAAALARPGLDAVGAGDLDAAEEAGLVRVRDDGRVEFTHPLFATAVYAAAPAGRRRETHRVLAAVVSDPEERARHLALSCRGPNASVARALERAALYARRRGAPDSAAELTELALGLLPPDSHAAAGLRADLARHLYLAGDFERARAVLVGLRSTLEPGDALALVVLTLAEIDYWREGESSALALAEEAGAAASGPLVRARCRTAVAMYAGTVDLPRAAAAAAEALALLERAPDPDPALVAAALTARVRADLFLGAGFDRDAAARARLLEEKARPAVVDNRAVFKLGQWLRYVDDLDGARLHLEEVERQAREEGDGSSLANILLNRMIVETWAGDWGEAARLTELMGDAFEQQGAAPEGIAPWRAYVDAHAGRLDAVRESAGPTPPGEPIIGAIWHRCLGLAELAAGDAGAADRHLAAAVATLERVDFREPAIWRVDGDAIEAAVATGDLDRAGRLLARFEERAARSRIPWSLAVSARCRGLLHAAAGALEQAATCLEGALEEHGRCPVPCERARTLLVLGQVRRRLKRKRPAREALTEALAIFRALGADAWAARAQTELGRTALRRSGDSLSPTELQIARLAAAGLTNRAIAREVFLTQKAVEANLARAYRKLGIRSRAQLARALDAEAAVVSAP